jgi:ankyrin repeat protein
MERCQFCLEHFRKDYSAQHESRCARKYWAKFCRNASLTNGIRDDESDEVSRRPSVRRDMSTDAQPVPVTENGLRMVHEIDVDTQLASRAFNFVFQHCWNTGDVDSCLEAITISFRYGVPIDIEVPEEPSHCDQFIDVFWLAFRVGDYVRGKRNISDPDPQGDTLMDRACLAGAAGLLEPLFWRGANFGSKSLLFAIESGSFDTVRFCLALGADPNSWAMRRGYMCNEIPLMKASANCDTTHIASLLIEYGATVFEIHAFKDTPLHLAARRADVDLLRVLLAKESSSEFLNFVDGAGLRALDLAIESIAGTAEGRVLEFVSALLDAGADTNGFRYRQSALCRAVLVRCGAIVRLLLEREPESPRKTEHLNQALMEASHDKIENIVRILIGAGATVENDQLEYALKYAPSERVELLLKVGAQVHLVEHLTWEYLFHAARDQ